MPESLTKLLKAHLKRQGKVGPASYVFVNSGRWPTRLRELATAGVVAGVSHGGA